MLLEFEFPWLLLLIFPCALIVFSLARRTRRGARGVKARVSEGVRYALIALAVLALAAPSLRVRSGARAVWLLADVSDSARAGRAAMTADVSKALGALPDGARAGVIAFGEDAMVEAPLSETPALASLTTRVDASGSDLSGALELAGALLPGDAVGRVIVLSDGGTNAADAQAEALAARGVRVDYLLYEASAGPDAQVTDVSLPAAAYQEQSVTVTVTVHASGAGEATVVLYQNRAVAATRDVTLRAGENTFTFADTLNTTGVATYEARVYMPGDTCAQNDMRGAYVAVSGAPGVLVVQGRSGEGDEARAMLEACGMRVTVLSCDQMPASAEQYRQYGACFLVNVDYDSVSEDAWAALEAAVRTLGRGLVVTGGDQSYALGGYRGSSLEGMLPVTCDVRSVMELPSLALVLVIDKSGSMTEARYGLSRLELAKEAAMRATEVLTPNDEIGVIAFDDACKWVVPLGSAEDTAAIQTLIGTIRAGGGTMFYTSLYEACRALKGSQAQQKHIIFLTDGDPADGGYDAVIEDMRQNGITLTTVAVGEGANGALLRRLAAQGEGRYYQAGEFDNIPKIFTKETYLVSGSYVQNRTFTPVITEVSELTDFEGFPVLHGYLAASEKPLSTVSLVSDRGDPILAWWHCGAGRVAAFTSDVTGAWSSAFLAWDEASAFFGGLVSHVLPGEHSEGEIKADTRDGAAHIRYTMPEGAAQGGLTTTATVLAPDGTETELALSETAPGVYEGAAPASGQGAYAITVRQADAGGVLRAAEGGMVSAYSREYDLRARAGEEALAAVARQTGGARLNAIAEAFEATGDTALKRTPLRAALLIALIALFVLDIAQRRIPWEAALPKREARAPRQTRPQPVKKPVARKQPRAEAPKPAETASQLLAAKHDRKKLF